MLKTRTPVDGNSLDSPILVAVVAEAEDDRVLLSTAIAGHAQQRVAFSVNLEVAGALLAEQPVDAIVGYIDSPLQWRRFQFLAGRFPDILSVLLLSDPDRFDASADGRVLNAVVGVSRHEIADKAAQISMQAAMEFGVRPTSIDGADELDRRRLETLSEREVEILVLTAEGLSLKEIALRIHRAYATVATHRMKTMEKLGLHDRVALARFAIRCGLIEA